MMDFRRIRRGSVLSLLVGSVVCISVGAAPSAAQEACLAHEPVGRPDSTAQIRWDEGEESAFPSRPDDVRPQFRDFDFPAYAVASAPISRRSGGREVSYLLAPWLKANLKYKHAFLFESSPSGMIRKEARSGFSVEGDRDIFDLTMSWELARSSLNLGYRLESTRPDGGSVPEDSASGWLLGSEAPLHGLTFGITRRWGGGP